MTPPTPITIRLPQALVDRINNCASRLGQTRQDFLGDFILNHIDLLEEDLPKQATRFADAYQAIHQNLKQLKQGDECNLKKLVGQAEWSRLTNTDRQNVGKEFKQKVYDGDFPRLAVGRKKSNNEQQYNVSG